MMADGVGRFWWVGLQSRFIKCREGESGEKNSFGDSLPLVEYETDARFEKTCHRTLLH